MIEAYPLQWPVGYPRTKYPERNDRFDGTFAKSRDEIVYQLNKMGAKDVVISTNVPLRRDGLPYASFGVKDFGDNGVAVYFSIDKEPSVLCCDKWQRIEWNMRAIVKTIDAMRGLDRWGVSEILKRVFTGFKAIPENTNSQAWYNILGVKEDASQNEIKSAYRNLSKVLHPDVGGNSNSFNTLTNAYQQGLKQTS